MTTTSALPMMHQIEKKERVDVLFAQNQLETWCNDNAIDVVLITAQDAFLSEYTPLQANHRYAVSGFSGSTGDGLFLTRSLADSLSSRGRFQLFVDGRYHLQADQETTPETVFVHKFGLATGMDESLFAWMRNHLPAGTRLAVDLQRVGWNRWKALEQLADEKSLQLKAFSAGQIATALTSVDGWIINRAVETLPENFTGRSPAKNLADLRNAISKSLGHSNYIYATCMSDDAAWILNARAYHLPQLSSLLANIFVTPESCVVHFPKESEHCAYEVPQALAKDIQVVRGPLSEALSALKKLAKANSNRPTICFSARAMNAALPRSLGEIFAGAEFRDDVHSLEQLRACKTSAELDSIRRSFLRSSRAIARTLRHAKTCAHNKTPLSELALAKTIMAEYGAEGARELSFKTISGFAENGAVIHYSNPSADKLAEKGQLLLLDSGAYYEEGFATDCTRVVLFGNSPAVAAHWQKEIYTLTLKACLAGLRAKFKLDTPCKEVDAISRGPIQAKGYDYAHGTGHGIGIHVHESGIRLSPVSQYTFTENAVVSVEPGIYLAGKGGVRIENVAIVTRSESPDAQASHCFENVVFVGYDWDLIDLELLSDKDKRDLAAYERKCKSLGTNVTECPLV
ncbi:MAG: hypothetical protein RI953_418 [Pseudomonadota bacterium]